MTTYQIKATPFFQRMLATSKKSGELQKLKEEYDRIKDFNEKAIESRMRQVRLKRLFQEIEEIKEKNSLKRRRMTFTETPPAQKLDFNSKQRLSNLMKAKEIGQYYSRCNAANGGEESCKDLQFYRSKRRLRDMELEETEKLKERINKRSTYGNECSNFNMHKMLMAKLRNEVSKGMKETANIKSDLGSQSTKHKEASPCTSEVDGKEKLKYRINYGNAISDMNIKLMLKRRTRSNVYKDCLELSEKTEIDTLKKVPLEDNHMQPGSPRICNLIQKNDSCDPRALRKSHRAHKNWHKLFISLKYLFDCQKQQSSSKPLKDSEVDIRYKLRSISNDTNLLKTDVIPEYSEELKLSESEDEYMENETLINAERLSDSPPSNTTVVLDSANKRPPPSVLEQRLKLKPIPKENATVKSKDEEVQRFMKLYEPFSMQVVEQEIFESGVQRLLQKFEQKHFA